MSEVIGKNGISARVVSKSICPDGIILTTWEYEAPKCILAEINTHGMLSKNAQSSRAVPVKKVIEQIRNNPVVPVHWGSNKAGMVAGEEIDNVVKFSNCGRLSMIGERLDENDYLPKEAAWVETAEVAAELMEAWSKAGYHKQIVNRIGEAFTFVKGVITATEIDNFFHLRYHPHADPYMSELARCMWEAYVTAEAEELSLGEWHTPYVEHVRNEAGDLAYVLDGRVLSLEEALKASSAGCAQVSYRALDLSEEKINKVWSNLMEGDIIHASVTSHQGTPLPCANKLSSMHDLKFFKTIGITHFVFEDGSYWSGNFRGWSQYRKHIKNESFKGKFIGIM